MAYLVMICHKWHSSKIGVCSTKVAQNSDDVFSLKAFGGKLT